MSKIYRYGKFKMKEENIMKRKLNYNEIRSCYYHYFVLYINYGFENDKINYIEKGFKILLNLENKNPHHRDIIRMYRFIKKENDGTNEKLNQKLLELKLQGKTYHNNKYLTVQN